MVWGDRGGGVAHDIRAARLDGFDGGGGRAMLDSSALRTVMSPPGGNSPCKCVCWCVCVVCCVLCVVCCVLCVVCCVLLCVCVAACC
jgi:hypothetical protein